MAIALSDAWTDAKTTTSKDGNGYMRLPNGMLLQWGHRSGMTNNTSNRTNFPVAFADTNYRIVFQKVSADHTNNTPSRLDYRTNTTFGIYTYKVFSVDWFAIGW